jgi:hypothetical protein
MCHHRLRIGERRTRHNSDEGASTTVRCSAQAELLVKQEASMLWSAITLTTLLSRRREQVVDSALVKRDARCYGLALLVAGQWHSNGIAMPTLSNVPQRFDSTVRAEYSPCHWRGAWMSNSLTGLLHAGTRQCCSPASPCLPWLHGGSNSVPDYTIIAAQGLLELPCRVPLVESQVGRSRWWSLAPSMRAAE